MIGHHAGIDEDPRHEPGRVCSERRAAGGGLDVMQSLTRWSSDRSFEKRSIPRLDGLDVLFEARESPSVAIATRQLIAADAQCTELAMRLSLAIGLVSDGRFAACRPRGRRPS